MLMKYLCLAILPWIGIQDSVQFRVSAEAVRVDVWVERDGKGIAGLTEDDFALFDDEVRQEIALVDAESEPLNVVLVVDTSASMVGNKMMELRAAGHAFVSALADEDRASIVTFSHHVHQPLELTSDKEALHNALDFIEARGATAWRDALFAAIKVLEPTRGRSLVLLFTDGRDTYSFIAQDQMKALVEQSSSVVYVVHGSRERILPTGASSFKPAREESRYDGERGVSSAGRNTILRVDAEPRRSELGRRRRERASLTKQLREVTDVSGGRLIDASAAGLQEAFVRVLSEMRSRYLLVYRPSGVNREGWHTIELELQNLKADVVFRRGYFYEPPR
ncbi:MAG: hypothetical protein BMS9Abin37_2279 [Acidobacteriota bacterium]|nr:MAG: hypothetical protein BMS9Abin37_2279 [Acidobacteriota bacterium]